MENNDNLNLIFIVKKLLSSNNYKRMLVVNLIYLYKNILYSSMFVLMINIFIQICIFMIYILNIDCINALILITPGDNYLLNPKKNTLLLICLFIFNKII